MAGGVEGTYIVGLGMNDGFRAYGVSFATCMSQTAAGCVPYSHDLMVLSGMLSTCVLRKAISSNPIPSNPISSNKRCLTIFVNT